MKMMCCWLLVAGLFGFSKTPEVYNSLPTYAPGPKIAHSQKGPKPNSKVTDKGASRATFVMTENHPPTLQLLVRANCGASINREDLINMAKSRQAKRRGAKVVDWKDVKGGRVDLWIVAATKKWERRVDLKNQDGKYVVNRNKTKEDYIWYVQKLISPTTFASCIDEEDLEKKRLWHMIFSGLNKIESTDRKS